MRKKTFIFTLLLCLIMPTCLLFSGCNNGQNTQNQEVISGEEYIANDVAWGLINEADAKLEIAYLNELNNVSIETKYEFLNGGSGLYDGTVYFARDTKVDSYIVKSETKSTTTKKYLYFNDNGSNYCYDLNNKSFYSYATPSLRAIMTIRSSYNEEDLLYCKRIENNLYLLKFYKNFVDSENDSNSYSVLCEVVLSNNGLYQSRNEYVISNTSSGTYNKKQTYVYGNVSFTELSNDVAEAISHL